MSERGEPRAGEMRSRPAVDAIAVASERHGPPSPRLIAAVILLAVLAAVYSAWPIWRALFLLEIDTDEPWNAYHADDVAHGRVLYPDPRALVANNYPPLSFYLIAALSRLGFDAVYVGRTLSLLAVAIGSLCVGLCVRELRGSRLSAVVASFWFLATMARFFDGYVGKNDPHLPALAITLVALVWFLRREARGRAVEPAVVLMAVAGFYKHSLIAAPLAALLWLATKNWRLALRAALVGAAFAAAGLLLCIAAYGDNFLRQLFFPREYSLRWALGNLGQLQWIAPALVIWAIWAWYDRNTDAARFSALYIAASLFAYMLQKLGWGIGVNAQFELVAATGIGFGLAFSHILATPLARRWGADRSRLVVLAIVIVRLIASNHVEPYLVLASRDYRALFPRHVEVMKAEVERIRSVPEPVHCTILTVCRLAGKPFVFDLFALEERLKKGIVTPAQLDAKATAMGLRYETIDPRAGAASTYRRLFSQIR